MAAPVGWDELATLEDARLFNLQKMQERLQQPDPWAGFFDLDQSPSGS